LAKLRQTTWKTWEIERLLITYERTVAGGLMVNVETDVRVGCERGQ